MGRYALLLQLSALALVALAAGRTPAPAGVPQAQGVRVALIDGDRVTTETEIGRRVRQSFEEAANDWQGRITAAQTELQTLIQNRQQQQLTLSADALAQLDAQIEEKQVALQRLQDDARRALERMHAKGTEEVNAVLIPALEAMAAEQGYDLVFDSRMTQTGSLLYFSKTLDVTDAFIERVNSTAGQTPQQGRE